MEGVTALEALKAVSLLIAAGVGLTATAVASFTLCEAIWDEVGPSCKRRWRKWRGAHEHEWIVTSRLFDTSVVDQELPILETWYVCRTCPATKHRDWRKENHYPL